MQLRFEPVLKRSRKRRPCALKTAKLAGIGAVDSAQFLLDRWQIDAQAAAFADDRASIHNHFAQQRRVASRKKKFDRVDRHDLVAIEAVEIDDDKVSGSARQQRSRSRRAG